MSDLIEFLNARIDEDEAEAEKGRPHNAGSVFARDNYGYLLIQPDRVLTECQMKRDIIDWHSAHPDPQRMAWGTIIACSTCGDVDDSPEEWPCNTLKAVSTVYSGHPDYRPEWSRD